MLDLRVAVLAFCAALLVVRDGEAGQKVDPAPDAASGAGRVTAPPFAFDGPPPSLPPEVISRDAEGRATVRAVRIAESLRIDGTLDERPYEDVRPMSDFIQIEPVEGAPASQRTEVWLLFDDENVYVSARCFESHPERMVANTMRHDDSLRLAQNEYVIWSFDTFYDRRNGFSFGITPIGGWHEGQYTNERQWHGDYNWIWDVEVGRFEGGWTFEAAIPFKSLRYRPGREQIWGFQVQRNNRWEERARIPHPNARLSRANWFHAVVAARDRRRPRGAAAGTQPGDQAVRHCGSEHRSRGEAQDFERPGRGHRPRCEVRHHPEPHGRSHREHRLRAGRSGRTAGQPDTVQPLLSREARVLPREPGDVQRRTTP
jgi:hypothetical protein